MFSVYKYTMKKYLKSFATWLIIMISFGAVVGLIGGLAYGTINYQTVTHTTYQTIINSSLVGMVSIFAFFGTIFVGYQGAKMFKDEVEDGTFLIVLSKPQTRIRIIGEKIWAILTMCLLFSLFILLAYALAVLLWDHPLANLKAISARQNLGRHLGMLFGIGLVILVILTSIALMFSTRFSAAATIGLTSAIAIFIPITGFIGAFVKSTPYIQASVQAIHLIPNTNTLEAEKKRLAEHLNEIIKKAGSTVKIDAKSLAWVDKLLAFKANKMIDIYKDDQVGLGRIAFNNHDSDKFSYLAFIDLNYQLVQLGSIISTLNTKGALSKNDLALIVGQQGRSKQKIYAKETALTTTRVSAILTQSTTKINAYNRNVETQVHNDLTTEVAQLFPHQSADWKKLLVENFEKKIEGEWLMMHLSTFLDLDKIKQYAAENKIKLPSFELTAIQRLQGVVAKTKDQKISEALAIIAKAKAIDFIGYKDYINPYSVLITYIVIALALFPIAYLLIRKQDFR